MRSIFLVSIVLNVALAVALVTWVSSDPSAKLRVVPPVSAAVINSNMIRIVKTNVLVRPRAFTWQEVESPDYAVYVENLRALGMPDSTIRDIIVADVNQLFAKRKREEDVKQEIEWWRSTPSYEAQSNALLRAHLIETDRTALLTKLLGPDWDKGRKESERTLLALTGPVLSNLTDDVKASVQEIANRSTERARDYIAQLEASNASPSIAELAKIREEARQQLAAILNPQQLEEFLIRFSETAARLRRELDGFNATPEEFRSLFRAIDAIDREAQLRYSGDDAASLRGRQSLEQQRLAAIRTALGPDRFAAYQTLRDPTYREALAVAQQAGAGDQAARALYEINRATTDEQARIRNDATLTDAQKQQQLQQAELEQQRARALVLGETPAAEATTAAPTTPPVPQFRQHALEPGQTLGQLAFRYGVSVAEIRAANPGVDINRARPGTVILVPQAQPLPYPPGAVPR